MTVLEPPRIPVRGSTAKEGKQVTLRASIGPLASTPDPRRSSCDDPAPRYTLRMRRFVILSHTAPLTPEFTLNDLPGGAGRLDVLCRAIAAAFFLSHDIRRNVEVHLVLRDAVQIRLLGERIRHLNPDERSTAALLKHALERLDDEEARSNPGIWIRRGGLSAVLDRLVGLDSRPIVLHEAGESFDAARIPEDATFVLSDHCEFSEPERTLLADFPHVSLGERALHTSHCITIVHYLLDRKVAHLRGALVPVHKVWSEPKAQLIKGILEENGVPVNLVRQTPPSVLPVTVDGLAEVQIVVHESNLDRARAILADLVEEPTLD